MDHRYIEQFNIVDHYLLRRLTEEEEASFEEHFVDCPICIDRLKIRENFIQDLRLIAVEQIPQTHSYKPETLRRSFFHILPSKPLALAAICLLLVGIVGTIIVLIQMRQYKLEVDEVNRAYAQLAQLYEEGRRATSLLEKERQEEQQKLAEQIQELEAELQKKQNPSAGGWMQPRVNLSIFVLNPIRGGEQNPSGSVNEVVLPRTPVDFVISLQLAGEAKYKDYNITILNDHKQPIWKRRGLKSDRYNSLIIGFNSRFFQPSDYLFVVEGITREGDITLVSNYPFRIIKNP
jgi:hypothetical protein